MVLALQAVQKSAEADNGHFGAKVLVLLLAMLIFSLLLNGSGRKN